MLCRGTLSESYSASFYRTSCKTVAACRGWFEESTMTRLTSRSVRLGLAIWALTLFTLQSAMRAQEPAKPDEPQVGEKKDKDVVAKPPSTPQEQTIYIPYEKLRTVFETKGRGVFLSYEKFRELWDAARENRPHPQTDKPPVNALITEVTHEATVARDVVKVSAKVKIDLLDTGWHKIPLRLEDTAITSATIGGQPARIVHEKGTGYTLLVERKKGEPSQIELALELAKSFTKTPGRNTVSFQAPQAPVTRWKVRVDEAGVKIDIHPLIAATDVPNEDPKAQRSEVLAFVGATDNVRIDWTPRAEGATGLEVLASVQAEQQVFVDETVIRTRGQLAYDISRAELSKLEIDVPTEQRVVNVYDSNVKRWSVDKGAKGDGGATVQRITVELFEPAKRTQHVVVELEQLLKEANQQTLTVPTIRCVGVGRQQGVVVVQVAEVLRAEATKRTGLLQLDKAELPATLRGSDWTFSYRYASLPFVLDLSVEKVQPRIVVESLVEANLQPERLTLDAQLIYQIERAGVFRLELEIPAGYEVRFARGLAQPGVEAAAVDTHRVEGDKKDRLIVNLSRKAMGRVGLSVQLAKPLKEADLLTPTGKSVTIPLTIPRVAAGTVERSSGRLVVYAPESLRVNPEKVEGLRAISIQEALGAMQSCVTTAAQNVRPVQAFAFADGTAELSLSAERRKPHVTVRQLLSAHVEAGVVKYTATFYYDILYSGVKTLRIDVPLDLAGVIHNDTAAVRETVMAPPPPDLDVGYSAWSLAGETEFLGSVTIQFSWERQLDKFDIGASVDLPLVHLKPRNVDRAWGQIVLAKTEAIDLLEKGEPKGVRPIDPQHDLMSGASAAGAARAFEFHEDWSLMVTATRYEMEEVKRTSIDRAVVRMVVTRSNETSVQALYRMRSARQRLAVTLPADAEFDTDPLRINGESVLLEKGTKDQYFVPLVGRDPETSFLLELRYSRKQTAYDLPIFPEEPAIQKVYLCVYPPEELAIRRAAGPWTPEIRWIWGDGNSQWNGGFGLVPYPVRSDSQLVQWVTEGIGLPNNPFDQFQRGNQLYVFSTLRPDNQPGNSLRLGTIDRTVLNWLVILMVVGGGIALVRQPAAIRAIALGGLIIVLVLLGVFQPMLASELCNGVMFWSVVIVLVVWCVWHFAYPRWRQTKASPPAVPPASESSPVSSAHFPSESVPPPAAESSEAPKPDNDSGQNPPVEGGPSHE
jgi:hypothetical protein